VKKLKINNNVVLLGRVKYNDVPKYYKIADIFCATSIYEGTCMTLHEAAASRLPIIATKFAGAVDLIKNEENGYLVEIDDSLDLSDKLKNILSEPNKIRVMGENNYKIFKNFLDKEKILQEHKAFFEYIKNN
jgi:glycosyltransferase involved in cell wall biosynthesis